MTKIPDNPNEISNLVADLGRDVFNGLIDGSMKVREYFETCKYPIDSYLAANIARFHAKKFIENRRSIGAPYFLKIANNNGIAIRQDLFDLKVVKGRNGKPPCPSKSKCSEQFYNQSNGYQPLLFPDMFKKWTNDEWEAFCASQDRLNLLLCWEVDESYDITGLQLVCPYQSWKFEEKVKIFWSRPIAHPVLGIEGLVDVNEQDDFEDLEIQIDLEAEVNDE